MHLHPPTAARLRALDPVPAGLLAVAAAAVLGVGLRALFVGAGIGMDEGGYAYLARRWANGGQLYGNTWVDRPQGLLLVYRAVLEFSSSTAAIRVAATIFGALLVVVVGAIAWLLAGPTAAGVASLLYAAAAADPNVEGFTLNGELVAALPAAAAVLLALLWVRTPSRGRLVLAGLLGGCAPLMKQSGFDGLVVVLAIVAAAPAPSRTRFGRVGVVAGAAAAPWVVAIVHGYSLGFHRYWYALVEERWTGSGATIGLGSRLANLEATAGRAWVWQYGLIAVALVGVAVCLALRPRRWVPVVWLVAALAGLNVSGRYWPHYLIQVGAPLCVLAALAVVRPRGRALRVGALALAVVPIAILFARVTTLSPAAFARQVPYDSRSQMDARIATYVDAHSTQRQTVFALLTEPDLYMLADRNSPYPFLWGPLVYQIPGALERLRDVFAGPHPPRFVVLYTSPRRVDPHGDLARTIARRYAFAWKDPVRGVRVLVLRPLAPR